MMSRVLWLVLLALPVQSVAASASTDGVGLLMDVIRQDSVGDASARLTWQSAPEDSKPNGEAYSLETDPLVIVRETLDVSIDVAEPTKVCVIAAFTVIARTQGIGLPSWDKDLGRVIQPVVPSGVERVRYCAERVSELWELSDPPIPRVSKKLWWSS